MKLDRLKSERFQHSVCMLSASCTLCMINDRQPPSQDQYIIYVCLVHHVATEVAYSLPYLVKTCSCSDVNTATIHAGLCIGSASLKMFTVFFVVIS